MSNCILLISDNLQQSDRIANDLGKRFHVRSVAVSELSHRGDRGALLFIVCANLSDPGNVAVLKSFLSGRSAGQKAIFIVRPDSRLDVVQAGALGASDILQSAFAGRLLEKRVETYLKDAAEEVWQSSPAETRSALAGIHALNDGLYASVLSGRQLPKAQVAACNDRIITSLNANGIDSWLEAVRQHHSYTYRHSMIVTGLAVSFALHLGMRRSDVERLATGALLHDVGKMRIPLAILDKPGKLSPEERAQIDLHPQYGADILRGSPGFGAEAMEIALHHHELLDGSGYPHGLQGDEISDPVRIVTIVDIFGALIDRRSYKDPVPNGEAYRIMQDMGDKLDRAILMAFEPIAQAAKLPPATAPVRAVAAG